MTWVSRIPEITAAAPELATAAVAKTVADVEAGAKARARVDTGAMRSGIQGKMLGPLEGEVVGQIGYTIFNEYGTSKMSAQPMFTPAADEARPGFEAAMAQVFRA